MRVLIRMADSTSKRNFGKEVWRQIAAVLEPAKQPNGFPNKFAALLKLTKVSSVEE